MKTNLVYDKESGTTVPVHLSCLQELVWLDGGHNGGPGAIYVTDQNILEKFASYNINVDVRLIFFFQGTQKNRYNYILLEKKLAIKGVNRFFK